MAVLDELVRACSGGARPAEPTDAVDGVAPDFVAEPRQTEDVAGALRIAAVHGLRVVARGAGTKLDWGNPPEAAELVLDLSGMDGVIEHVSDDLVARARAGTTLAHLSEEISKAGQRFPVDEVVAGSTLGGVVSTGLSGPGRFTHGGVRDVVIGATVVRADGVVTHAGSKVVKNVAGYDLTKLFTGSYGTLGVVTEVTMKLKPMTLAQRFVVASHPTTAEMGRSLSAILRSRSAPTAIELERPGPDEPLQLSVLIEGRPAPVEQRSAEVAALLGSSDVRPVAPPGWGVLPGPVTLKLTSVLSGVPVVVEQAGTVAREYDLPARVAGSAGSGVLFVGLPAEVPAEALGSVLEDLRRVCGRFGGHAVLLRAPAALKAAVDVWGPVPGLELMRRLKEQFDPGRRLAPGRFVGGI